MAQETIGQLIDEEMERGAFIEVVIQRILLNKENSNSMHEESGPRRERAVPGKSAEQAQGSEQQDAPALREQYGHPPYYFHVIQSGVLAIPDPKWRSCYSCRFKCLSSRLAHGTSRPAPRVGPASGLPAASPMPQIGHRVAWADTADTLAVPAAADGAR